MFFTLYFTKRDRYTKAVRYLMAHPTKYNLICRGIEHSAAPRTWYVYFSRRVQR